DAVELRCISREHLPSVLIDRSSLEQILTNLALNAREAMPSGGTLTINPPPARLDSVDCASDPQRRPGDFVCLHVRDTGKGMDEATRNRLFEPFFTTKAPDQRAGMGLATVYGLVKQHNGWIEVSSAPDEGCTLELYFPI